MKKIIFISDYSNTKEKVKKLHELLLQIKKEGYEICLSSHVSLPQHIINECNYYFYDNNNDLLFDFKTKIYKTFINEYFSLGYKPLCTISSHLIAILRLFSPTLSYLKSLGYEIVHYLEYDNIINNFLEFLDNEKILNDYDSVFYMEEVHGNTFENPKWFIGNYFAMNLKGFDFNDLIFEREKILNGLMENILTGESSGYTEKITFNLFFSNKKNYPKRLSDLSFSIGPSWSNSQGNAFNIENSICFVKMNEELNFFVDNLLNDIEYKIQLILDDDIIKVFNVEKNIWAIYHIEKKPNKSIVIIINDNIVKKLDLQNGDDLLYLNSFNFFPL